MVDELSEVSARPRKSQYLLRENPVNRKSQTSPYSGNRCLHQSDRKPFGLDGNPFADRRRRFGLTNALAVPRKRLEEVSETPAAMSPDVA